MAVGLAALPAPDVVEALDYETILRDLLADYRARDPEFTAWLESEPAVKLLETAAYREMLLRARVNDAARACMVGSAEGADLDNLAAVFGVARLAGESDAALRERTTLSLGAHNTAGSAAGYAHWARAAGAADVCVDLWPNTPGTVRVTVSGGVSGDGATALDGQPSIAMVNAVNAALARDDVRPVTDVVRVRALRVQPYTVDATVTVAPGADRAAVVAAAEASVRRYCARQHNCGPRNAVRRTGLIGALMVVPGVEDATLTEPAADVDPPATVAAWPTTAESAVYGEAVQSREPTRRPMDGVTVAAA